jgi:bifunctional DNA-binding transcriptional regulator/antitoxin component of YhaV-PrlF toxin-antitoxin module
MGIQEGDALEMSIDDKTGGLVLVPYFSEAPDKIRAIAESLNTMGYTPEEWEIAEELKAIAKRLKEIRKTY